MSAAKGIELKATGLRAHHLATELCASAYAEDWRILFFLFLKREGKQQFRTTFIMH